LMRNLFASYRRTQIILYALTWLGEDAETQECNCS